MFQLLIGKIVKEPSRLKILLNAFAHLCVASENNLHPQALAPHIFNTCDLSQLLSSLKRDLNTKNLEAFLKCI